MIGLAGTILVTGVAPFAVQSMGADFHAVHILTLDTIFRDQISHKGNSPAIAALASVFAARMQGVTIKACSSYQSYRKSLWQAA